MRDHGFTLIEILIVIAILVLLSLFVLMNIKNQSAKAWDAKRKSDLHTLATYIEEYRNDHDIFPPIDVIGTCTSTIPCDPQSHSPYGYFLSANGGYRICAKLTSAEDPVIAMAGCDGSEGCGLGGGYNYCLATGTTASAVGTTDQIFVTPTPGNSSPTPTPTPTLTPTPTPRPEYACAPPVNGISICNHYINPDGSGCPRVFYDALCESQCDNAANWCLH